MEMTTTIFKWTRALSRDGFTTSNLYFSQLHESSYYVKRIVRPHYIAVISNYDAINEFSLATNTFDMSFAAWLVLFIYKGRGFDYCHSPPGNIFHLKFNSEMLVRCGTENILREWYSIDSNRTEIDDLTIWNLENGMTKVVKDSLYDRRYNLHGLTMRAVIVKDSPFVNVNENNELEGTFGKTLKELSVTLNFSLKIVSSVDEYGIWNSEKNTWSGAIGEIYSGRADISISDFSMTSARLNVVDFTFPLIFTKHCIYIKEPNKFTIKWSSYFQTFSYTIWIAIFGILTFATIVLIFLKIKIGTDHNIGQLLSYKFLKIWGIFCQQGLADFPDRSSLRIAYFSIFLLAVVLSAAYSAALISFLTSAVSVLPFHSLEGLIEDGTYQFIVFRGAADYDIFTHARDPFAKKLIKLIPEENKLPLTIKEGFERVCENQKIALYASVAKRKAVKFKTSCNTVCVNAGRIEYLGIILSKNNPYTEVINFHLQKFFNNGMMNRLKDITLKKELNFILKHESVDLTSVISLIFFILIGTITKYRNICKHIYAFVIFSTVLKFYIVSLRLRLNAWTCVLQIFFIRRLHIDCTHILILLEECRFLIDENLFKVAVIV
ncbi:glutamate receptor ionotropic, delta-1-like [Vespa velutina]|uniref:glutamate receptor ionotropic, delta-1-like n=1 Tax=Vespa velutina TaxID=202808 RepID=UPI001FB20F24|nr:glutamate receptor ionotropic, delta-1-like [Vespa velutina]